jgi:thioredoxin 1
MSLEISDATFQEEVINSTVPVLVDFWAPWCGPCKVAGPIIDQVGIKAIGKAKVFKMNVDDNPLTAGRFGISAIPTVLVFKSGKVDRTLIGVQQERTYLDALGAS